MDPFARHLVRIGLWGAASLVAGLWLARHRHRSRAWHHAAVQSGIWGAVNLALALAGWRGSPPSAAFLWANVGLDAGYAGVAVTLLLLGRRAGIVGAVGAGWAVLPQGLFLLVADLIYLAERGWR